MTLITQCLFILFFYIIFCVPTFLLVIVQQTSVQTMATRGTSQVKTRKKILKQNLRGLLYSHEIK